MRTIIGLVVPCLVTLCLTAPPRAQEPQSEAAVSTLTGLLDAKGLDACAATDPDDPERFIAALYFSKSQLLVVSAKYAAPALMTERLNARQHRDIYADLQGTSMPEGKWFMQDMQANGLRPDPAHGEQFDQVFRSGTGYVILSGDWDAQSLTRDQYRERFQTADAAYTRMLNTLAAALRTQG